MNARKMLSCSPWNVASVLSLGLLGVSVSFAADDSPIKPRDTVIVTIDRARLFVPGKPPAGLPKGTKLEVTKLQDGWVAGYVSLKGKREAGWVKSSAVSKVASADWPRFCGPNGDNMSPDTGLLREWPEGGPKLTWTTEGIGHGFSGVTLADGLIYTDGNIDGNTVITAMDMDGQIQWQVENSAAWGKPYPGTRGTPTIDGDWLYHQSPLGEVICLNAKTGKKVWGLNILKRFNSKNITWALSESLLVDGERVICCPGGPEASVVALDKRTGRVVWKSPSTGDLAGYASPTLAEYRGLRMILTMTSKALIGVNPDNGDLLWRFEHITPHDENIIKPVYHDGHVFISTINVGAVTLRINVDGDKATVDQVWRSKELDNQHGGVLLLDGCLYGASHKSNGAKWICLDWDTGRMMYAERGVGEGSLTCADGMLYTMSERGTVGLVKPTPTGHEVVSRFRIPPGGEGPTWAHPVVCGGCLYIRHSDRLFAYDVRETQ